MYNNMSNEAKINLIIMGSIAFLAIFSIFVMEKQTIKYHNLLIECRQSIIDYNEGFNSANVWGDYAPINISFNKSLVKCQSNTSYEYYDCMPNWSK